MKLQGVLQVGRAGVWQFEFLSSLEEGSRRPADSSAAWTVSASAVRPVQFYKWNGKLAEWSCSLDFSVLWMGIKACRMRMALQFGRFFQSSAVFWTCRRRPAAGSAAWTLSFLQCRMKNLLSGAAVGIR